MKITYDALERIRKITKYFSQDSWLDGLDLNPVLDKRDCAESNRVVSFKLWSYFPISELPALCNSHYWFVLFSFLVFLPLSLSLSRVQIFS